MIEIRRAREDDFGDVLPLLRQLWPNQSLDAEALRRVFTTALTCESQVYLSACDGPRVIGFASLSVKHNLWQAGKLGHLDELVVDETYRGRGVGRQLLTAIAQEARQQRCARLELDSAFHRESAHAFYEQRGFERRAFLFSLALDGDEPVSLMPDGGRPA